MTLNRVVTRPYVIPETNVTLETGTKIVIPVHAIHYDAKYYPDPHAFDPERFSDENVHGLQPNTYMPFGDGPRFCIGTRVYKHTDDARVAVVGTFATELNVVRSRVSGKRFAEFEMKMALSEVLANYEVTPCDKTQIPVKYVIGSFVTIPESIWLKFRKVDG